MRVMTPLEKVKALNPDFGENYMSNIIEYISEDEWEEKLSNLKEIIPELPKEMIPNALLLYQREAPKQNKMGFIFHDFKNGDYLAITSKRKIVLVKKGQEENKIPVENFTMKTINGQAQRVYCHNGETVIIGAPERIIGLLENAIAKDLPYINKALDEFAKNDIYIEENKIFVPNELEYSSSIVVLLSINNPTYIKQKLENCIIYKDTGVTLGELKQNSEEINSISYRYGTKIKGTKLRIVETDEILNIYFTRRKYSTKEKGKFSIFSI